jgi:dimethylargininase
MIALVRQVSPRLSEALVRRPGDRPADPAGAAAEHAAYVAALRAAGAEVRVVPPEPSSPDDCFIEDTVVVAGGTALLTRPGAARRRAEVDGVAAALPAHLRVVRLAAPATLDGGDVLRVGRTIFVGLSGRTNEAALDGLEAAFAPEGFRVVPLPVGEALHLKCFASPLGDDAVLWTRGAGDPGPIRAVAEIIEVEPEESYAANAVVVGRTALVAAGFPGVAAAARARGLDVVAVSTRELARADGSLTCLSVLLP